jgi:DNA polymerase elongation subunit (family B)
MAVYRDAQGRRATKMFPAQHVCYLRVADVPDELERNLRASRAILEVKPEGAWLRLRWRSREVLETATRRPRRPNPVTGKDCYFDAINVRTYEADVHPVRRFLTEQDVTIQRPRICYLDLETDSRVPFSRKEDMRILCWAVTAEDGTREVRALNEDTDADEKRLLRELWAVLDRFDLVAAWNGDNFDFPVLKARTIRVGLAVRWAQWLWLDQMELYRKMNMHVSESGEEKESVSLDRVATNVLGETKDPFDASKTWEAWEEGGAERERLVKYNLRDAELQLLIEQKTGYVGLHLAICEVTWTLPDSRGMHGTNFVEGFLLRRARDRGMHFRTMWDYPEYASQFAGAFVLEPTKRGILRDVHVADFTALYPSIIQTWNISPETIAEFHRMTETEMRARGWDPKYVKQEPRPAGLCEVPGYGAHFRTDAVGLLAEAVTELRRLRKHWSDLKASLAPGTVEWHEADRRSNAYKVAANTCFGVVGSPMSRFFDKTVGESITQGGVYLIQQTIEEGEARGVRAIYGDSITGDRTVVLRRPDGRVCIAPVEYIWKLASEVEAVRGKEFAKFDCGWEALARDERGIEGWFPLVRMIRHGSKKVVWKLSSKRGQVEVTGDHSIMVKGERVTPEGFVQRGLWFDRVKAPASRELPVVDVWPELEGVAFEKPYKGRIIRREFAQRHHNVVTVVGWGTPKQYFRREYAARSPELHALLRVVGAYISEGSASLPGITTCRYMFSLSQNKAVWLDRLKRDIRAISVGVELTGPQWSAGAYYLRSGAALLACTFAALCGYTSRGKRLPEFAYDLCHEDFLVLWNMLVEGDGSHNVNGGCGYTSVSQQLIAGLSFLLDQHGVEHAIHYRKSKGAWTIRTRPVPVGKGKERVRSKLNVEKRSGIGEWVYDLEVAGAHTFVDGVGRVLLHNTDSTFSQGVSTEQFRDFVAWCNVELYPRITRECGCAQNVIELAYEKAFEVIVLVAKKRYIGRYVHFKGKPATVQSKPEIKGLEYKRGDCARLARKMQAQSIDLLMGGGVRGPRRPHCEADPAVFEELVRQWRWRVLEGELTLRDVRLSKSLGRGLKEYAVRVKNDGTPMAEQPHVQVARILHKRGREVSAGVRINYVVTDATGNLKVLPAEDWTPGDEDRHYLWENLVYPPTQRLLECAFPGGPWRRYEKSRPPPAPKARVVKAEKAPARPRRAAPVGQGSLF